MEKQEQENKQINSAPAYPLTPVGSSPLEREMHAELKASWEAHHAHAVNEELIPGARDRIFSAQDEVKNMLNQVQEYLEHHLSAIPTDVGCHGTAVRIARLSDAAAPFPNHLDLVKLSMDANLAMVFNPFLTAESCKRLQQGSRRWLELCVLDDRLQRIIEFLQKVESLEQNAGEQALLFRVRIH